MPDPSTRSQREQEIAAALLLLFGAWQDQALAGRLEAAAIQADVEAALFDSLLAAYEDAALGAAADLGVALDLAALRVEAELWAANQTAELAHGMAMNTADAIRLARTEAATAQEFADRLRPIFSPARAATVGATETTRAFSAGEQPAVARYEILTGQTVEAIWNTEADDRVCPICAPLDGQDSDVFGDEFPTGPPAHPNCRCFLTYVPVGSPALSN